MLVSENRVVLQDTENLSRPVNQNLVPVTIVHLVFTKETKLHRFATHVHPDGISKISSSNIVFPACQENGRIKLGKLRAIGVALEKLVQPVLPLIVRNVVLVRGRISWRAPSIVSYVQRVVQHTATSLVNRAKNVLLDNTVPLCTWIRQHV